MLFYIGDIKFFQAKQNEKIAVVYFFPERTLLIRNTLEKLG